MLIPIQITNDKEFLIALYGSGKVRGMEANIASVLGVSRQAINVRLKKDEPEVFKGPELLTLYMAQSKGKSSEAMLAMEQYIDQKLPLLMKGIFASAGGMSTDNLNCDDVSCLHLPVPLSDVRQIPEERGLVVSFIRSAAAQQKPAYFHLREQSEVPKIEEIICDVLNVDTLPESFNIVASPDIESPPKPYAFVRTPSSKAGVKAFIAANRGVCALDEGSAYRIARAVLPREIRRPLGVVF